MSEYYKQRKQDKTQQSSRYCTFCSSSTHDTQFCSFKNKQKKQYQSEKSCTDTQSDHHNFAFLVSSNTDTSQHENWFLIDNGATVHIINDKDKFVYFNRFFVPENHVIQLADWTKASNMALAQGDATVLLQDHDGVNRELTLKRTLSTCQAFSKVATKADATVNFFDFSGTLTFCKTKNLYYINTLQHQTCKKNTLKGWHTGIFVGYDRESPAYLLYFPVKEIVKKVRRVKVLDSTVNEKKHKAMTMKMTRI